MTGTAVSTCSSRAGLAARLLPPVAQPGRRPFRLRRRVCGLDSLVRRPTDFTFTGNFADIDGDERQDLLVSSDFGTSRVFLQDAGGRFHDATGPEITDENGMGAAVGDIDGDGDLDWFVSSVWDPEGSPREAGA
jgi:hypothetical protein